MKKIIPVLLLSTLIAFGFSASIFAEDAKPVADTTAPAVTMPTTTATTTVTEPAPFTAAQIEQLHQIIRDYLVKNPEVLVEASKTLQAQQETKMEAAAMTAIQQNKDTLFNDPTTPNIGSKEAPATLVEFFDYQCGHCREMAPNIEKLVTEDKNLHVVFKELPIFGGMSQYAAKVALAAAMQSPEKYYAFHNALFAAKTALTKENIMEKAKKVGLNMVTLKKDMDSPAVEGQLKSNFTLAQALKIMGTPTFVIANKAQTKFAYIPGAISLTDLQKQIQSVQ